jgi:hypothetical protein
LAALVQPTTQEPFEHMSPLGQSVSMEHSTQWLLTQMSPVGQLVPAARIRTSDAVCVAATTLQPCKQKLLVHISPTGQSVSTAHWTQAPFEHLKFGSQFAAVVQPSTH